jgi:diadenosine tetraphosphate (Ap4A) HIT family hydrolase
LIDRADGGHIVIEPKEQVRDRQALSAALAIELMRLTVVTGEAMTTVMNKHGVDIGRINYQDNGNWSVFKPEGPFLHVHLYGRAKSAKVQHYGQTLYFPHRDEQPEFYAAVKPLSQADVIGIRDEMNRLIALPRYSDNVWKLT